MTKARLHKGTRRLLTYAGRMLTVAAIGYLAMRLWAHWSELGSLRFDRPALGSLLTLLLVWVGNQAMGAYIWQNLLRVLGAQISFRLSYSITGRSQIGKYLPGNVFQYVGRVGYATQHGVAPATCTATIGAETIYTVFAAATVIVAGMLIEGPQAVTRILPLIDSAAGPGFRAALAGILIIAVILIWRVPALRNTVWQYRIFFSPAILSKTLALSLPFFVVVGLFVDGIAGHVLHVYSSAGWFECSWRMSAAWLLGFVVPGAPGGLGIREAAMVFLFGPLYGEGAAAMLAILVRFTSTIADLVTYVVAVAVSRIAE